MSSCLSSPKRRKKLLKTALSDDQVVQDMKGIDLDEEWEIFHEVARILKNSKIGQVL